MPHGIQPSNFQDAVRNQIALWEESRELVDRVGDKVYRGTSTPLIITDETIGGHVYNKIKTERERRGLKKKHPRVEQVAQINSTTQSAILSETYDSAHEQWEDLALHGSGIFGGMHPVMKRDDAEIFIYGTADLITFLENRPVHVLQLRGTKPEYIARDEPFSNMIVAPWMTCWILDRGGFDVDDLSFTVLRYDRVGMDVDRATLLAQLQHLISSHSNPFSDGRIERAINGSRTNENSLPDFAKDTFDYERGFEYDGTQFYQLKNESLDIIRKDDFLDEQAAGA